MYPSKNEILDHPIHFPEELINMVLEWKKTCYTKDVRSSIEKKNTALARLVAAITTSFHRKNPSIVFTPDCNPHYNTTEHCIYLSSTNPSIITTLHETAHYLFGPSEHTACRWSVQLFKLCFPDAYKKLVWNRHMLKHP